MKKIPCIFKRDINNIQRYKLSFNSANRRGILNEPNEDCLWVFEGEGVATRKYDGTCVLIKDGKYFKRREVKKGKEAPQYFVEVSDDHNTGKKMGWVPVDESDNGNRYHLEAFYESYEDGTYELVGPKIQGNPEKYDCHTLISHKSAVVFGNIPRDYDKLKDWLYHKDIEGIVFQHEDGRMAKIRKTDFFEDGRNCGKDLIKDEID